jgi:aminopeptidase N
MILSTSIALALGLLSADSLTGPGVARALAEHRARDLSELRYALRLDLTSRDTAVGQAELRFERRGTDDLVLDFRGPSFGQVVVNGRRVEPRVANGHLILPAGALRRGANVVSLDFRALIAPSGASIISYDDASDRSRYLYTLLVPADANQLFPCFDQPDLKARVSLTLVTPPAWSALANGRPLSVDSAAVKTVRFAETEPISTYLVAFAAGPWAVHSAVVGGRPISMWVRASRAREAEADSLIALNARALRWLERYTATPFPFQKYDFLLAPAFPFGGMEHPGAVFYNEESFIFRERPTLSQLLGREATVFHEVVHQWFGDYATMRWFDDLWLKEGFATYLAAVMQADLSPASNAWKTFYLRNKPAAYAVDASAGTTPVWQQLANLDQAKSNYGAIVYNKAPGILKQLNYLVGDSAFRDGLRLYLRAHPYGNAGWRDLLAAVGTASGRPLDAWGRSFILRAGMPVLTQRLELRGGRIARLVLEQEPARALSGAAPWPMRVQVLLGYADGSAQRVTVELTGARTTVPVAGRRAPDYVFANADDEGYALVRLDERSVRWLESHVGEVDDPFLRAMLWGALWDQVRGTRYDPARFVRAALRALPQEGDEQIAPVLLARVSRAASAYLSPAVHDALLPELEVVLRAGGADVHRPYGVRKAHLDAYIALAASASALASLDSLLNATEAAGVPLRAPTRWAIVTALVARGARSADARLAEETRRDSTSEGRRRAFVARAARPDSATKASYWSRYFADRSLNEEWVTASLRAFNDPDQETLTRRYLVPALDSLPWVQRNRRIFFLGSWIGAFIDGQRSGEGLAEVDRMLAASPSLPRDLREKILQSRDELERTVAIRAAFAATTSREAAR